MIDRIHGGNIGPYLKAGERFLKRDKVVDFSVSINPLGLPPRVEDAILKNIRVILRYPDPDSKGLKSIISAFYGINQSSILAGNGSIELIHLIPRALKARNALIIGPTFSEYEFAVRLNGARAFFALPGLRLGYLVGQRRMIERLSKFQYPWNLNSLAQAAAGDVFNAARYINLSKNFIAGEQGYLLENLSRIKGLKIYRPAANFVFCKLENCKIRDSARLNKKLCKNGIIIRCCHNFRGLDNSFFRIAVRTRSENKRLLVCLKRVL